MSASGKLADARILVFATHGLLPGNNMPIERCLAEPALVLTPSQVNANSADFDHDNGLLAASDVAQLRLNADWVVLSACNTAGGQNRSGEALSGLARAFFYAGARAVLVSQWEPASYIAKET